MKDRKLEPSGVSGRDSRAAEGRMRYPAALRDRVAARDPSARGGALGSSGKCDALAFFTGRNDELQLLDRARDTIWWTVTLGTTWKLM